MGRAEDLPEELGRAVDDARLAVEVGPRGDEADDLHHSGESIDSPGEISGGRERIERADPRRVLRILRVGSVDADRADAHGFTVNDGDLAGGPDDAAVEDRGDVGGDGGRNGGKLEAELGELSGGEGHEGPFDFGRSGAGTRLGDHPPASTGRFADQSGESLIAAGAAASLSRVAAPPSSP